jgi:hypothetical protein
MVETVTWSLLLAVLTFEYDLGTWLIPNASQSADFEKICLASYYGRG